MTMAPERPPFDSAPLPEDLRRDDELEVLLDEMVRTAPPPALGDDFTRRVVEARPFAPWEVRSVGAWRIPAAAAGGVLAASLTVFLAPLWYLGPGTALAVWGRVLFATFSGALSTALTAAPLIAATLAQVFAELPGVRNIAFLGLALTGGMLGIWLLLARRRRENVS
jgi:hypothetical protein